MNILVKTDSSIDYVFEAERFEIHDSIAYFYDVNGQPVWVIRDWLSFRLISDEEIRKSISPDEFYETMDKDEK